MQLETYKSSMITWTIMDGGHESYKRSFCADGDGIVEVLEFDNNHYCLSDQAESVKQWQGIDTPAKLFEVLEEAQNYLAKVYNEIYQLAKHGETI